MKRRLWAAAAGLWLAPLLGLAAADLQGSDPRGGKVPPRPVKPQPEEACGRYGTSVEFVGTPAEAARQAKKEQKLVFVLHVSGHFEDPELHLKQRRALRVNALANPEVGKYLNEYFVSSFQKVATFRIVNGGQKQGGNVASYFCAPDGRVLHVVRRPGRRRHHAPRSEVGRGNGPRRRMADSKGDGGKFKAVLPQGPRRPAAAGARLGGRAGHVRRAPPRTTTAP